MWSFEWDARKDAANRRKHGVFFHEAATVFADDQALLIPDPDHSRIEERYLLLGLSDRLRMLVVCHCLRRQGETIRIISARRANRFERNQYRAQRSP